MSHPAGRLQHTTALLSSVLAACRPWPRDALQASAARPDLLLT